MAKVKGPLFSIDARGAIGSALVFGGWKGIPWVREWVIPQNPNTSEQQWIRLIFTQAVDAWHFTLTEQQIIDWQTAADASGKTMSGFNFHLAEYVNSMKVGETPSADPPAHLL